MSTYIQPHKGKWVKYTECDPDSVAAHVYIQCMFEDLN